MKNGKIFFPSTFFSHLALLLMLVLLGACGGGGGSGSDEGGDGSNNNGPWLGSWIQVNFLTADDNGVFEFDDLSGIGFTAKITESEWVETDDFGNGCAVTFSYSVDSNNKHSKRAVSKNDLCPVNLPLSLLKDSGRLEFSADNKFMIEYFDLQPGDDILAFKWMRVSSNPDVSDGNVNPPTNLLAVSGSNQIVLTWDFVATATSYNLYWSTMPNVTPENGIKIANVVSPYTHSNLTEGETYYYVVTAEDGSVESVPSNQSSATLMPVSPGGFSISGQTFYSTTPLSGIKVELREPATTGENILQTTFSDANGNYTLTGLAGDPFQIRVYGPGTEFIGWRGYGYSSGISQDVNNRNLYLVKNILLLTPANTAAVSTLRPSLSWTGIPEAVTYRVQINVTDTWELVELADEVAENSYIPSVDLSDGGSYTWQVDATDAFGHDVGGTMSAFRFTVEQAK